MQLSPLDVVAFVAFVAVVIAISVIASRTERDTTDYFLAGRRLTWWLIGFSLIASNISTEHFVGMAGQGFGKIGLAVASYEWIAALTMLAVAFWLLPLYLRLGIYTMPEFLERRFGVLPRTIMAIYMLLAYVGVAIASVLYSGALALETIFGLDFSVGVWLIGCVAGAYTIYGGLKAVVWTDLLQGGALLLGALLVAVLTIQQAGGLDTLWEQESDKLHTMLPADDPDIPWTAFLLGIWIPNFFYWGCNQFITQRALGAKSLGEGQLGIVCAAWIKLSIPFLIVVPGILAVRLYGDRIDVGDRAYAVLVQNVLPAGLRGLFFAALFGAVMSSLDSMLNSASTIFTMDLWQRWLRPEDSPRRLVAIGRVTTGVLVLLGCCAAYIPTRFEGVYRYIQLVWGFVSPGIAVAFLFGLVVRRAPGLAATVGLLVSVPVYAILRYYAPDGAFLNQMAISAIVVALCMLLITWVRPRAEPFVFSREGSPVDLAPSRTARRLGILCAVATVTLYVVFF